jgi:hypothetical protein
MAPVKDSLLIVRVDSRRSFEKSGKGVGGVRLEL